MIGVIVYQAAVTPTYSGQATSSVPSPRRQSTSGADGRSHSLDTSPYPRPGRSRHSPARRPATGSIDHPSSTEPPTEQEPQQFVFIVCRCFVVSFVGFDCRRRRIDMMVIPSWRVVYTDPLEDY